LVTAKAPLGEAIRELLPRFRRAPEGAEFGLVLEKLWQLPEQQLHELLGRHRRAIGMPERGGRHVLDGASLGRLRSRLQCRDYVRYRLQPEGRTAITDCVDRIMFATLGLVTLVRVAVWLIRGAARPRSASAITTCFWFFDLNALRADLCGLHTPRRLECERSYAAATSGSVDGCHTVVRSRKIYYDPSSQRAICDMSH
jgi:hypothetical protein